MNLEAKKKEKEQLNKEIQEWMDRAKELDKEIQSLETQSKLKKDVAGAIRRREGRVKNYRARLVSYSK